MTPGGGAPAREGAPRGAGPCTRLAPSPTGALHLGNARSFLLAWLWARAGGAEVVLRIEDLDGPRTRAGAVDEVRADLAWLGLDWDREAPLQSARGPAYAAALAALHAAGRVYPCVCTRAEVERAASAPHEGDDGPVYPGTCRGRFASAAEAERETGRAPCWRFALGPGPGGGEVAWDDAFRGREAHDPGRGGDFVVAKRSGEAAYQLAVVVDDAAQGVTDVIRGDDLVPSTPRQLLLYAALGLPAPRFAHLPLVRGPDGRRLAKRHGDSRLAHYRALGVSPARVVALLARWSGLAGPAVEALPAAALRDVLAAAGGLDWARVPRADVAFGPADDAWLRAGR